MGWLGGFARFAINRLFPCHSTELNRIAEYLIFTPFYEGKPGFENGGLAGTRTRDQCLKRALLYQLSYQPTPKWSAINP